MLLGEPHTRTFLTPSQRLSQLPRASRRCSPPGEAPPLSNSATWREQCALGARCPGPGGAEGARPRSSRVPTAPGDEGAARPDAQQLPGELPQAQRQRANPPAYRPRGNVNSFMHHGSIRDGVLGKRGRSDSLCGLRPAGPHSVLLTSPSHISVETSAGEACGAGSAVAAAVCRARRVRPCQEVRSSIPALP